MATYLILAAVALICAYAVYSYIRKLRVGGGCCGEREAAPKRVKVRDRDKRHYPYVLEVTVDGMVCANCARRVENALNSLDGVWARVEDVGSGRATVDSPAALTVAEGKMTATIVWSSPNYDYMIVDGEKYLPTNTEGNSTFEIPVAALGTPLTVTADTVAMSKPHEIEYTLTFTLE